MNCDVVLVATHPEIAYFVVVFLNVEQWADLKESTMDEFAVGGRSFKWYMIMFTVLATSWFGGAVYTVSTATA